MSVIKVNFKWGKQKFENVEVDVSEPALLFKTQVFTLTGVPPERQKIMVKGGLLKDDAKWSDLGIKEGHTFMVLGSAEEIPTAPPAQKTVFLEDLPDEQAAALQINDGIGLVNLGNTCYLNSTIQCLRAVKELDEGVTHYTGGSGVGDGNSKLAAAFRNLVKLLGGAKQAIMPLELVSVFREVYPQFAQKAGNGGYMQQDAEECWTQLLAAVGRKLPSAGTAAPTDSVDLNNSLITKLFGGEIRSTFTCDEAPEEEKVVKIEKITKLVCHVSGSTNFMLDGLKEGMEEHITKQSPTLNREAKYTMVSRLTKLPYYLTVQFMRFFWKADVKIKAKIVRPVEFPMTLDIYDLCSDDLKAQLAPKRKELQEKEEEALKKAKEKQPEAKDAAPAAMEVDKTAAPSFVNETGIYELAAVLTHKGRSADSGHYIGWVRQTGDDWLEYDDDRVTRCKTDDIKKLSGKGGGDWHIAYICLYRTKQM